MDCGGPSKSNLFHQRFLHFQLKRNLKSNKTSELPILVLQHRLSLIVWSTPTLCTHYIELPVLTFRHHMLISKSLINLQRACMLSASTQTSPLDFLTLMYSYADDVSDYFSTGADGSLPVVQRHHVEITMQHLLLNETRYRSG